MKKFLLVLCAVVMAFMAFPLAACDNSEVLIVATNAAFPPFEYKEGNKIVGIDMDLARELGDRLNVKVEIKDMSFDAVITSVSKGSADIAIAALTKNAEREKYVNFSDAYYEASQYIIVKSEDTTFDNLTTKEEVDAAINALGSNAKIGFQNATTGEYYARGSADWEFEGFANATKTGYENGSLAMLDLLNGRINIIIIDEMPARALVEANPGTKIIEVSLTEEEYAIAVNKKLTSLLNRINEALKDMKEDGTFATIVAKYYAPETTEE